jgi:hypothetical protein
VEREQSERPAKSLRNPRTASAKSRNLRTAGRDKYADLAHASRVPEFHAEQFLHLAGLSHKSALIAWGAFYFKTRSHKEWKPPRRESVGARSDPYGPARVNVYDASDTLVSSSFTETTNFCWVTGLVPNTEYRYEVIVKGEPWGVDRHPALDADPSSVRGGAGNLYLRERIASDEASGRASVDPGLFYRFRYGRDVPRFTPSGEEITGPIMLQL